MRDFNEWKKNNWKIIIKIQEMAKDKEIFQKQENFSLIFISSISSTYTLQRIT